jgi:hypothetical protein
MTKRELKDWQRESVQQAVVRVTLERYQELQEIIRAAGQVA